MPIVKPSPKSAPADPDQLGFSFLIPYSERKTLLNTHEAAKVMGISQESVRVAIESRELEAHRFTVHGTKADDFGKNGSRLTNRVTRRSVLLWLAKTADYQPDAIADACYEVAKTLGPALLKTLVQRLTVLLNSISNR